jgi:hypothetical protein
MALSIFAPGWSAWTTILDCATPVREITISKISKDDCLQRIFLMAYNLVTDISGLSPKSGILQSPSRFIINKVKIVCFIPKIKVLYTLICMFNNIFIWEKPLYVNSIRRKIC